MCVKGGFSQIQSHIIVAGGKHTWLFGLFHDIEVLNINDPDDKMKWRTVPTKLPMECGCLQPLF